MVWGRGIESRNTGSAFVRRPGSSPPHQILGKIWDPHQDVCREAGDGIWELAEVASHPEGLICAFRSKSKLCLCVPALVISTLHGTIQTKSFLHRSMWRNTKERDCLDSPFCIVLPGAQEQGLQETSRIGVKRGPRVWRGEFPYMVCDL